ncbi:Eukaryotic translation initiation factor 4 gamma [Tolypocladium capitatum]|uniref:Eukaryotic translation initiation factor 4 gamma n=1 Tax=Tolypocladium capitatum TaxID=45235 RepID=A0A2K3QI45_9HYPO|nr:Eukaryotic translation initiation factor 4 gamma [Tolypocladium capitatum]
MTSPANRQNPIPATNTSATTATSYASAAGAPKKPTQAPVVATGSQPPAVVGGASASPAQNAKAASSPSPVNGKPAVTPAVPAVARGSSAANGSVSDHSRKTSVTMAANGPSSYAANGGPVGGAKSGIQFGFDSPAMAHSTPQTGSSAPIPIPGGNPRVASPAHSPSPIPQPSASGGRPPSGLQQPTGQMTFGSLSSDGERHMRQGSIPPNPTAMGSQPGAHFRRESSHSVQSDNPGGPNRVNFPPQGGRGRGSFNPHGNSYNNQMGYPPNNQFRNGPGQSRGMPPSFQPQPRNMPYPNSPQPARSPALVPSMPNTPNMAPANMQQNMSMQTPPQYHYPPPMAPQHQQVHLPFPVASSSKMHLKPHKKNKGRREQDKPFQQGRQSDSTRELHGSDVSQHPRRYNQRADQMWREHNMGGMRVVSNGSSKPSSHPQEPVPTLAVPKHNPSSLDLSPENGGFELWLTIKNQNFGYPPQQVDQYGRPMSMPYGYNNMPYMGPPQTNSPGYGQQYAPPAYHPQGHSMSRSPSQPERPSSANHQNQPVIVSSTPQTQNAQPNPAAKNFVKPGRKSAAIQIKNAAGEVVDTSAFKQPASPAPSVQQSKTPPVVSSTPTPPPPKSSTPSHGRTESLATPKTVKEIQDELKEKIKQATAASAETRPKEDKPMTPKVQPATPEAKPNSDEEAVAPSNPKASSDNATSDTKVDEAKKTDESKPVEPAKPAESEEDEIERMIREMEEADAKREKEEEEHRKKREAEKAAAKKKEDEEGNVTAAEADRKLREQEREMERLEEEKEKRQRDAEASGKSLSVSDALAQLRSGREPESSNLDDVADMKIEGEKASSPTEFAGQKPTTAEKRGSKPAALNLVPLNTKPVEPPQASAALQSLKSARFLQVMDQEIYPAGINSPNPALNAAVAKKGKTFKYDASFLLQFKMVFVEQPSIEFHQQVKSLIGDADRSSSRGAQTPGSGRQNSRSGNAAFSMGSFNVPPGRTLPPGTTSSERLAMASGTMARPPVGGIGSFTARTGAPFPGSTSMSRTSSQSNMRNLPSSPRQSSRSTRGSRRGDYGGGAKEAQAAKTMPLTAGMDIKPIAVSSSGWKPTSIGKGSQATPGATGAGYLDPEMVQRKVKAALNKMTPEKFDRIADQILEIASQSKDESDGRTLRQVIQLTFEKATDEAHWASMYAKFCKRMLENMSPEVRDERIKDKNGNVHSGGNLFRKYLLNRCQEEFERGWTTKLPEQPDENAADQKPGEAALLSDEYYVAAAAKRRGLGLVQFIGELYKLGMLTERIMHECVHKLVDYKGVPDEAEIESLSKLLRTIGANLDQTEKGRPMMDAYFQRILTMVELPELQSRMKFMLMDIVDLRRSNWISKELNKGPKTLEEVRAEAEAAQAAKAQEAARSSQRGGGGRPPVGRGDARNFSAGYAQQTSNQVGMDDLRRLKGSASRTSSQHVTLGPTSMFSSRSNSGRRLGPGGSLGRPGEDSGASSRTGTPPTRDATSNSNAFSLLANMETEHPASPPSAGPSPSLAKAVPDSSKKESE